MAATPLENLQHRAMFLVNMLRHCRHVDGHEESIPSRHDTYWWFPYVATTPLANLQRGALFL